MELEECKRNIFLLEVCFVEDKPNSWIMDLGVINHVRIFL